MVVTQAYFYFSQNKESKLIKGALLDHPDICLFLFLNVNRKCLGKHVPAAMNTHVTTEELLNAVVSMM
jgi:hypothetical protein